MRVLKPVYPVLCTFPISLFRPCALLVILNNKHPRLPIFPIIYDERAENSVPPPLPLVKSHSAAAVRGCAGRNHCVCCWRRRDYCCCCCPFQTHVVDIQVFHIKRRQMIETDRRLSGVWQAPPFFFFR